MRAQAVADDGYPLASSSESRSTAAREGRIIATAAAIIWIVIERTETCDRFFDWVAENPDYEVDSAILAFLLAAIGIAVFAWRRYRDAIAVNIEREAAQAHVQSLAYHDPLTGLPNRRALNERLTELERRSGKQTAALMFLDLDRFKGVNDLHGHIAGDNLLRLVAERLEMECAGGNTVFRLGGDEFAILVESDADDEEALSHLARLTVSKCAQPFQNRSLLHYIGVSVGVALFPSDGSNSDDLARCADVALYRAKHDGRGQYRFYETKMDEASKRRAELEQEMRIAIKSGDFRPYYQPLVNLSDGSTTGFELPARWTRDDGEKVSPEEFIAIAEESGLINDLMMGLIDKACQEVRHWDPSLTIAINISPAQLKDPWLSEKILGALARHGFPPARIAIEITENAIIADEENAKRTIESLKNQGMRVGLDDFGTGYASLHHLRVLPFDKIKIDKSFTSNLTTDPEALKLIRAIVGLATTLDLPVVAEGVETEADAQVLRRLGCAQGQGFLFGQPAPGESVSRALSLAPSASQEAAGEPSQEVRVQPDRRAG